MEIYDSKGIKFDIQLHEDTNWEALNSDGSIIGRIINGIAYIRFANFTYNVQNKNELINICKLPQKYASGKESYFFLTESTSNLISRGLITNIDNISQILVDFREIGTYTFYGFAIYPI